jgi:dTMP kinase
VEKKEILRNFIVFEGQDGSGTSTQLGILNERLAGTPHWTTVEPTDLPSGRLIRSVLSGQTRAEAETLARLFAADRYEHIYGQEGIKARLDRGELVVCDRYFFSSLVYQSITCGFDLPWELNSGFPLPEYLLFFRLPPEVSMKRLMDRRDKDIFENADFQALVSQRYESVLGLFLGGGMKQITIDATGTVDEISAAIWRVVSEMPILKR